MIDVVFPDKNENEFIEMAKKLGFRKLCFVYGNEKIIPQKKFSLPVVFGILNQKKQSKNLLFYSTDFRHALEKLPIDVIFGMEKQEGKDRMHSRSSGLNQVLCKIAASKNKIVAFSFSDILDSKNRPSIIGKMVQNIMLCQKYKVPMAIASFAQKPEDMRNPYDIQAFFSLLGMRQPKKALSVLEPKKPL